MNAYEKATKSPIIVEFAAKLDELGFTERWVVEDRWGYTLQCRGNGQMINVGSQTLIQAYRYAVKQAMDKSKVKP